MQTSKVLVASANPKGYFRNVERKYLVNSIVRTSNYPLVSNSADRFINNLIICKSIKKD